MANGKGMGATKYSRLKKHKLKKRKAQSSSYGTPLFLLSFNKT
jgi:hypothetical protein